MSVLALKALDAGAESLPDKFFEKIPGGYFKPPEKKKNNKNRTSKNDKDRSSRRSSRRDHSPYTDYSDYSAYDDTDYERERDSRRKDRNRRAKSAGGAQSESLNRGRDDRRSRDLDGEYSDHRDMAQNEQGGPYFPPPPSSDYRPYNPQPASGQPRTSTSASRYTPGPGYAPSPVNSGIPVPPVGANSPYPPYNPAEYTSNAGGYQAGGNPYPSPPPFNRHRSSSQPASPPYPTYIPPSAEQRMTAYDDQPSSHRGSTKSRRDHRHRARSADTHSSRKDSDHDPRRDPSRMTKMRERFDDGLLREGGLAAAMGGALAGGFAGRQLGKSKLTTLAGAAAGAFGAQAIAGRSKSRGPHQSGSRSRSRSRSRHRRDDRARSRDRSYERSPPRGLRARSRSIIDRFRSKSRGPPEDRETRKDKYDRPDRGYDRPDHGYDRGRGDDYDSYSSESDGSPVSSRRHRKRRDY